MAELQENINKIQLLEQNVQAIAAQKQQTQTQLFEIESALKELDDSKESYKILANIMIKTPKDKLKKELNERKEVIDLRMKTLEKQEKQIKEQIKTLQEEIVKKSKKK